MIKLYFRKKIHGFKLKLIKKWCDQLGLIAVVIQFRGSDMYIKMNDGSFRKVGRR